MQSVHYFPRYSQKENGVTNNTLLLFLRLMEFSRNRFESYLLRLAGDADLEFSPQWLHIGQQKPAPNSVVDGYIAQDSVRIAVETKLGPVFGRDQLERHLEAFGAENHRLLVLLCPSAPQLQGGLEAFRAVASKRNIQVLATTFEKIISVMREVLTDRDEEMLALIEDFESFCTVTDLLPDGKYFIFTPPCGPSHKDNEELHLYYCPNHRSRRSADFLGIYADKVVRAIGRIKKAVPCTIDLGRGLVSVTTGETLSAEESERILEAAKRAPSMAGTFPKITHSSSATNGQAPASAKAHVTAFRAPYA